MTPAEIILLAAGAVMVFAASLVVLTGAVMVSLKLAASLHDWLERKGF